MTRRWLPSLRTPAPQRHQTKAAVDRRYSAGPNYTFAGTPMTTQLGDMDLTRAVTSAYQRDLWVWRIIDARAKSASRLDVIIKDGRGTDARPIEGHRLGFLLNRRANPYESGQSFRYRLRTLMDLSIRGVPIEVVETRGGDLQSLHILNPMHTFPIPDPDKFVSGFEMRLPSGEVFDELPRYTRGKGGGVLWFKRPHPTDPYRSTSWLEAAALTIDTDYWARRYNLNFLMNDGRPGGVLLIKGEEGIDTADAVALQARMSGGPDAAGKVTIMEGEGMEYIDLATSPRDAQYVQSREITMKELLIAGGTPLSVIGDASGRCVDDQTEALTQRGWVGGRDLTTNDVILSVDPADGQLKWGPVREVYRNENYSGAMYRLKHIGALVSPGHKWVIEPRTGPQCDLANGDRYTRVEVETLVGRDRIITMGDAEAGTPEPEFSDAFVELVGWTVTEGHYFPNVWSAEHQPNKVAPYVRIRQNAGPFADRIERCAKEVGASHIVRETQGRILVSIRGEVAAALQAVAPDRILTVEFLLSLTSGQRRLLMQTMIDGDGCRQSSTSSITFAQKDKRASEAFVFLATLCGYTTSMRERWYTYKHAGTERACSDWIVIVRASKVSSIQHEGRTRESYTGLIWCPRTDYGTFVARRGGKVFATSNTFDNADAEYEIYWRQEMVPELELDGSFWEELTDGGIETDTEVVTWDYDKIAVLQRDARSDEARAQVEFDKGLISVDDYLTRTGRPARDIPGTRVLWLPQGKAPVGAPADVSALLSQGQPQPPPGALPPPPNGPAALPPGGDGPPALPAGTGGEQPATLGAGERKLPGDGDVLDEATYASKSLQGVDPGLVERRRREHAALIDHWSGRVAAATGALLERQQRVVLSRLTGAKARQHTRHWDSARPATHEVKALDPGYVVERAKWISEVVSAIADVVSAAFAAAGSAALKQLGVGGTFDAGEARGQVVAGTVRSIAEGLDARAGRLQRIIADAEEAGESIDRIAQRVTDAYLSADTWAEHTSRQVVAAMNAASLISATDAGALAKRWLATDDERTRATHHAAEGQVVAVGKPFVVGGEDLAFPGDPDAAIHETINCFVADTEVDALGVEASFANHYAGDVVTVRTRSGRVLTGTPNHPVLTDAGWCPLGSLDVGSNLVCTQVGQRVGPWIDPDVEHMPTTIVQVRDALTKIGSRSGLVGVSVNFHGDRPTGDVEVVTTDRALDFGGNLPRIQHAPQSDLKWARPVVDSVADGDGAFDLLGVSSGAPSDGMVSVLGEGNSLVVSQLTHADVHRIASVACSDTGFGQLVADRPPGDVETFSDALLALTGEVGLDDVVGVQRDTFEGHVYNLQTTTGIYLASGIVAHNCRCTMLYQLGKRTGDSFDAELAALGADEWKALRGFAHVDVRFDPNLHPRDWRGRFLDVPDVTLPDGSTGTAAAIDSHGDVTVTKHDGDVVKVPSADLTSPAVVPKVGEVAKADHVALTTTVHGPFSEEPLPPSGMVPDFLDPGLRPQRWQLARTPDDQFGQVVDAPDAENKVGVLVGSDIVRYPLLNLESAGPPPFHTHFDRGAERHVYCSYQHRHWGAAGGAGVLIRNTADDGTVRYLLQLRAPWVQHGGTWSTPGGAMHLGEDPLDAGLREADEELGGLPDGIRGVRVVTDDHGGWAYHTVVLDSPLRFATEAGDHEGVRTGWFTPAEMAGLPLHPSFKESWPQVNAALAGGDPARLGAHPESGHPTNPPDSLGDFLDDPFAAMAAAGLELLPPSGMTATKPKPKKPQAPPVPVGDMNTVLAAMLARAGIAYDRTLPSVLAGDLAAKSGQTGDGAKARASIPTVTELIDKGMTPDEAAKEWKRLYNNARFRFRDARLKAAKAALGQVEQDVATPPKVPKVPAVDLADATESDLAALIAGDAPFGQKPKALYTGMKGAGAVLPGASWHVAAALLEDGDIIPVRDLRVQGYNVAHGSVLKLPNTPPILIEHSPTDAPETVLKGAELIADRWARASADVAPELTATQRGFASLAGANPADAHWAIKYDQPGFTSAATGGNGTTTFWNGLTPTTGLVIHEWGHNIDRANGTLGAPLSQKGLALAPEGSSSATLTTPYPWPTVTKFDAELHTHWASSLFQSGQTFTEARKAPGDHTILIANPGHEHQAVSDYATNSPDEDFAESIRLYLKDQRLGRLGHLSPEGGASQGVNLRFVDLWPERAAYLDTLFGNQPVPDTSWRGTGRAKVTATLTAIGLDAKGTTDGWPAPEDLAREYVIPLGDVYTARDGVATTLILALEEANKKAEAEAKLAKDIADAAKAKEDAAKVVAATAAAELAAALANATTPAPGDKDVLKKIAKRKAWVKWNAKQGKKVAIVGTGPGGAYTKADVKKKLKVGHTLEVQIDPGGPIIHGNANGGTAANGGTITLDHAVGFFTSTTADLGNDYPIVISQIVPGSLHRVDTVPMTADQAQAYADQYEANALEQAQAKGNLSAGLDGAAGWTVQGLTPTQVADIKTGAADRYTEVVKSGATPAQAAQARRDYVHDHVLAALLAPPQVGHLGESTTYDPKARRKATTWLGKAGKEPHPLAKAHNYGVDEQAKSNIAAELASRLNNAEDWETFRTYRKAIAGATSGDKYGGIPGNLPPFSETTAEERQKILDQECSNRVGNWASTAGDQNPWSIGMQRAIDEEFGTGGDWNPHGMPPNSTLYHGYGAGAGATFEQAWGNGMGPFFRRMARVMHENTQDQFAEAGITHVALFRGMNAKAGSNADWMMPGEHPVTLMPASSWSASRATAANFGGGNSYNGRMLVATFPVGRILGSARTGYGCLNEREFVVLNGPGNVTVYSGGSASIPDGK